MQRVCLSWLKIAVILAVVTIPACIVSAAATPGEVTAEVKGSSFYQKIMTILNTNPEVKQPAEQAPHKDTPIFGPAEVSKEQMAWFIKRNNPLPSLDCSVEELTEIYYEEAVLEGVRPDLALAQAIVETGFFRYGRDVLPEQNNYCGLGTTGNGVRGEWFVSPRMGVRAHIQHLLAYSTDRAPRTSLVDPRYGLVRAIARYSAQCSTWESLGGKWAIPGKDYGVKIVTVVANVKKSAVSK